MSAKSIRLFKIIRQVELLSKMNTNHFLPVPVSCYLPRKAITQSADKDGDHLWMCIQYKLSDSGLRPQKRIRVIILVAGSFRMKTDNVSFTNACQVRQDSKRIFIERSLVSDGMVASGEKRRIHGPPSVSY